MATKKRSRATSKKKPTAQGESRTRAEASRRPAPPAKKVSCWEDDPGDPRTQPALSPITVAAPAQATAPLPFRIGGSTPTAQIYQPGTANFRYYAAACALRRTADFWGALVGQRFRWQVGSTLAVQLDSGVDLNAYYTRGGFGDTPGLHFFHQSVGGRTYFSGESPDVVSHEMGHAVLDALRPQLFNAQTIEAAAFHESFGDMTAILTALQVPSFRQAVVNETQGVLNRSSRLSRLAEQLGAAIRIQHPDAVDPDCLRNAANSFFYRDPQALPTMAPASALSSEPHSFSRVFTAGFLDALAGMAKVQGDRVTEDMIAKVAVDLGRILLGGVQIAPVVPDYYSQVAAHMITTAQDSRFDTKYRDVLKSAFVRRGILSLQAAATVTSVSRPASRAAFAAAVERRSDELPIASISAAAYGLTSGALLVHTPEDAKQFAVTSSSLMLGPLEPRSAQNAAESFTEDLFQRGRVEVQQHAHAETALVHPLSFRTHVILQQGSDLILKRRSFDCGWN